MMERRPLLTEQQRNELHEVGRGKLPFPEWARRRAAGMGIEIGEKIGPGVWRSGPGVVKLTTGTEIAAVRLLLEWQSCGPVPGATEIYGVHPLEIERAAGRTYLLHREYLPDLIDVHGTMPVILKYHDAHRLRGNDAFKVAATRAALVEVGEVAPDLAALLLRFLNIGFICWDVPCNLGKRAAGGAVLFDFGELRQRWPEMASGGGPQWRPSAR